MQSSASRLTVVGPAFAVGAALAGLSAKSRPDSAPLLWLLSTAGPFAGQWAAATWGPADAFGWAGLYGLAIAVHPLRTGLLTGAASAAGVWLWVLLGLALTFDGV